MRIKNMIYSELIKIGVKNKILNFIYLNVLYYTFFIILAYIKKDNWYITYNSNNYIDFLFTHLSLITIILFFVYIILLAINSTKLEFKNNYYEQNIIFGLKKENLYISKIFMFLIFLYIIILINILLNFVFYLFIESFYNISLSFPILDYEIFKSVQMLLILPFAILSFVALMQFITFNFYRVNSMVLLFISILFHFFTIYNYLDSDNKILENIPFLIYLKLLNDFLISDESLFKMLKILTTTIFEISFFYLLIYFRRF